MINDLKNILVDKLSVNSVWLIFQSYRHYIQVNAGMEEMGHVFQALFEIWEIRYDRLHLKLLVYVMFCTFTYNETCDL